MKFEQYFLSAVDQAKSVEELYFLLTAFQGTLSNLARRREYFRKKSDVRDEVSKRSNSEAKENREIPNWGRSNEPNVHYHPQACGLCEKKSVNLITCVSCGFRVHLRCVSLIIEQPNWLCQRCDGNENRI